MTINNQISSGGFSKDSRLKVITKAVDEVVNNSTAVQDDDELFFPVKANEIWHINLFILFDGDAAADIVFGWSVPAGTTMQWSNSGLTGIGKSESIDDFESTGGVGSGRVNRMQGVVTVGDNAGDVKLHWAQFSAQSADTTVKAGSTLIALKV